MKIRQASPSDLDAVFAVESACFPPEEAATYESLRERLGAFKKTFLVAEEDGKIIGLADGCVTSLRKLEDRLYESTALHDDSLPNEMVFGLAVLPEYQHRGIAKALMSAFIENARRNGKTLINLTCKERLIPFYEQFGYKNEGISGSTHGGVIWYDMTLFLR